MSSYFLAPILQLLFDRTYKIKKQGQMTLPLLLGYFSLSTNVKKWMHSRPVVANDEFNTTYRSR